MEGKKEVTAGEPVAIAGLTLVPIIETRIDKWGRGSSFALFGYSEPVAVIVITPDAKKVFRMDGGEVALEKLENEFPGLDINFDTF